MQTVLLSRHAPISRNLHSLNASLRRYSSRPTFTSPTHRSFDLPSGSSVSIGTGLFINNDWVPAQGGQTFESISPSPPHSVISTISSAQPSDLDIAVSYARKAFNSTWGRHVPASDRGRLLSKLADLVERDAQVLAEIEAMDSGKPVRVTRDMDLVDVVSTLRYYAGWFIEINDTKRLAYTRNEPIGVVGQIIPWNYPLGMLSWKIGPALAVGCVVLVKPSELTSLSVLKFCELIIEAGYPPGAFQCLPGLGSVAGAAISSHHGIDKVAFTGSTTTGRKIAVAAAQSNLKPVTLELGGKSPCIIFDSANIETATDWAMLGTFFNMGQDCTCNSRIFIQAGVYDKVVEMLVAKSKQQKIGHASDESTFHGPLVSKAQFDRVMGYIESAKSEGARLVSGGKAWKEEGWWVEPTIFVDCKPEMTIVREEIFGPVMAIQRFETEEQAIKLANETSYGLAGAVFSTDVNQCMRVSSALEVGTCWVNMTNVCSAQVPFGGKKQSGIGRELGKEALSMYTSTKSVQLNFGEDYGWPL